MFRKITVLAIILGSNLVFAQKDSAHCRYEDRQARVKFEFDINKGQDDYKIYEYPKNDYYRSTALEEEYQLIGIIPLTKAGVVDRSKEMVGMGFNTATGQGFIDQRGDFLLECK